MKVLVTDNDDSFTYNLVQLLEQTGLCDICVKKSAELKFVDVGSFDKILISPGPGLPDDFPVIKKIISAYGRTKSILGICLGHQAIAETFGGQIENMNQVRHGIVEEMSILDPGHYIFRGIPDKFRGGLYHSWRVSGNNFPEELQVIATDRQGTVMGLAHRHCDVVGLQFHPESVMTPLGASLISNWLRDR